MSVETQFENIEAASTRIESCAKQLQLDAKKLTEAARTGSLSQMRKFAQNLTRLRITLAEAIAEVEIQNGDDLLLAIKRADYLAELEVASRAAGLGNVKATRTALLSFPYKVTLDSSGTHLKIGTRSISILRPTCVATFLSSERGRDDSSRPLFLACLREAYLSLTNGVTSISVPLVEVYERLTLLPKLRKEYSEADFFTDVCFLDSRGPTVTTDNLRLSLPASTSARMSRGFTCVTENGEERTYASLRFDPVIRVE